VRVQSEQLDSIFDATGHQPTFELFTRDDGLPSLTFGSEVGWPRLVTGGDGRVWLSTAKGVAWIDPARLRRNLVAPAVYFHSLAEDGVTLAGVDDVQLMAGVSRVEIRYGAASFTMRERVRYRYRLDGLDTGWVEAGTHEEAFYTNLAPGRYTFRVMAANEDGLWSEARALSFTIPPTFLQSRAFIVLCLIATGLAIWGLFTLRVRQISSRLNARLAERLAERERIARELHDTLLQGFHGLMLHFQAVLESIPKRSPARAGLEEALDRADAVLIEGRDRVAELRRQTAGSLANMIEAAAGRTRAQTATITISEEGEPRELTPIVLDEAGRIGEEALTNALRHAQASAIDVAIAYARRHLRLTVSDNGVGLDETVAKAGHRPGHFGLIGMRERAASIQASLSVRSRPGGGVEVVLIVPASVAYADARPWARRLRIDALFRFRP
jgi:signal transduction histidine kinase